MCPLLDTHVDPVVRWQRLLQADADTQADDGSHGAVVDGWRDVHDHLDERVIRGSRARARNDVDVWQVHHRQLAKSEGVVLRVRDRGYKVYDTLIIRALGRWPDITGT